jgi:hypothetical protein
MNLTDHDPGSLRDAIAITPSGGTVDFQAGLTGAIVLTTGELMIAKNLTISGPGASVITVSGNHASRVFNIAASFTVAISGLTIADGAVTNANGGGIFNAGTLTVTDSIFSDNSTSGIFPNGSGGAVYNAATLAVIGCTLSRNSASVSVFGGGGGGIYNAGTLTVTRSVLSGNFTSGVFGGGGGGIYNAGALTVSSSILGGNSASGDGGGGIYTSFPWTVTITNSTLSGNSADGGGGIINFGGTLTITSSTLSGNSASSAGGAIDNIPGTLTITSSTLSDNFGGSGGGGIYNFEGAVFITDSTISGNSAAGGGGIANGGANFGGTLTVTDSVIHANVASGAGGGIVATNNSLQGTTVLLRSIISENTAFLGGGIGAFGQGTLTVSDCLLSDNNAPPGQGGGGIFTDITTVVTRSLFMGNTAREGGAISFLGVEGGDASLTATESTFRDNRAVSVFGDDGRGGAISYGAATTLSVSNCTFAGNHADGTGGGISEIRGAGAHITLANSTITGNSADRSGGGVFTELSAETIRNTVIAQNAGLDPDVSGPLASLGHNLIGDGTGGSGFADTDLVGTAAFPIDPMLEPLGDYGGPTQTMRPLPASPVINAGDNTDAPDTDQRGFPRIVLGFIDIGAVELQPDEFGGPGGSTAAPLLLARLPTERAAAAPTGDASAFTASATQTRSASVDRQRLDAFFAVLGGTSEGHGQPEVLLRLTGRQIAQPRFGTLFGGVVAEDYLF